MNFVWLIKNNLFFLLTKICWKDLCDVKCPMVTKITDRHFSEKQHVAVYKKQMTAPKYFNVTDYNGLIHVWFCFSFSKVTISRPTHLKYEGYSVLWPMSINTVYINTIGNFRNQSENVDRHKMFLKFLFLQIFYHIMTFLVYTNK